MKLPFKDVTEVNIRLSSLNTSWMMSDDMILVVDWCQPSCFPIWEIFLDGEYLETAIYFLFYFILYLFMFFPKRACGNIAVLNVMDTLFGLTYSL